MKLFYLTVGNSRRRFDTFVHAPDAPAAAKLWAARHADCEKIRPKKVACYDLSQTALCPAVMEWASMPCTIVQV